MRRRLEEVGEDEDERACSESRRRPREIVDPVLERAGRRVERRRGVVALDQLERSSGRAAGSRTACRNGWRSRDTPPPPRAAIALSTIAVRRDTDGAGLRRATATSRGRGPSTDGGRRRPRHAAPRPRSARGRRTRRRRVRSRAVRSRASRSSRRDRPGRTAAEPARSVPRPRLVLRAEPNGRPRQPVPRDEREASRPAQYSLANARDVGQSGRGGGTGSKHEVAQLLAGHRAYDTSRRLGEECRAQDEPVAQHGNEQVHDVVREDVVAPLEEGPGSRRLREGEGAADRRSDLDLLELARRADEADDPLLEQLVEVDVLGGTPELGSSSSVSDRGQQRRAGGRDVARARPGAPPPRPDSRASRGGRTGRAALRAAGTSPRTRSGSRSRSARNGSGSGRVTPSTVTWCSAIASSSADWVFGVARLISSTRTTFAKSGPGWNTNARRSWSKIESPVASVGCRSGVHWMRENSMSLDAGRDRPGEDRLRRAGHVLEQDVPAGDEGRQDEADLLALAVDDRLEVVDQTTSNSHRGIRSAFAWLRLCL